MTHDLKTCANELVLDCHFERSEKSLYGQAKKYFSRVAATMLRHDNA
jgi:hypothetical protein